MVANHIHDALSQVHKLQELVLARRQFRGYSGKARIACGFTALAGAAVLASNRIPDKPESHFIGWGIVLAIAVSLNYISLAWWFFFDKQARRNPRMLKPAIDALPALGSGAILTYALLRQGAFNLLPGTWMLLYGLAQVAYRNSLPAGIYAVGIGYLLCGTLCLIPSAPAFTNPWPMGTVFFIGELAGGLILLSNNLSSNEQPVGDAS